MKCPSREEFEEMNPWERTIDCHVCGQRAVDRGCLRRLAARSGRPPDSGIESRVARSVRPTGFPESWCRPCAKAWNERVDSLDRENKESFRLFQVRVEIAIMRVVAQIKEERKAAKA